MVKIRMTNVTQLLQFVSPINCSPINEMTTKADGLHSLIDGRQIKGTVHSVGGCNSQDKYPTGNPYKDLYTILSCTYFAFVYPLFLGEQHVLESLTYISLFM